MPSGMEVRRSETAPETLTDSGWQKGGPVAGACEEAEHPVARRAPLNPRRAVLVKLCNCGCSGEVERLAAASGMCQEHFNSAALLLGARRLGAELSPDATALLGNRISEAQSVGRRVLSAGCTA